MRRGGQMEGGRICVEILAVGPLFQELDFRSLEKDLRRPDFFRRTPLLN